MRFKTIIAASVLAGAAVTPCILAQGGGEVAVWAGQPFAVPGGFNQVVYQQNQTSTPVAGPIALEVRGLSAGNRILNRSYIGRETDGGQYPVILTGVGAGQNLQPGQTIQTVLAMAAGGGGWTIVSRSGILPARVGAPSDVNGDGISDTVAYRPSTGEFIARITGSGQQVVLPAVATGSALVPAAADYDGDGRLDAAVFDKATGDWRIRSSASNAPSTQRISTGISSDTLGVTGDVVAPADFDGDGKADPAIYSTTGGKFWYRSSRTGASLAVNLGTAGRPAPADYDGDGVADFAVFATAPNRVIYRSSATTTLVSTELSSGTVKLCGGADDDQIWAGAMDSQQTALVPGLYDSDLKADFALYNRMTGKLIVASIAADPEMEPRVQVWSAGGSEGAAGRYNAGIYGGAMVRFGPGVSTLSWMPDGFAGATVAALDTLSTAYRTIP